MGRKPTEGTLPVHTYFIKCGPISSRRKVLRREVQFDRTKGRQVIKEERLAGFLPPYCDDLSQMEVVEEPKRGRPPKESKEKSTASENIQRLLELNDDRDQEKVVYGLDQAFFTMIMASGAGMGSCVEVEQFWQVHHDELARTFPDLPDGSISHDLIRNFYIMLGKIKDTNLLDALNAQILQNEGILREVEEMDDQEAREVFLKSIYALDGQAVRATKQHAGSKHPRYVLNVFDCSRELVLAQMLVGEKSNEIPHGRELMYQLDIQGSIVTADAMHANTGFVQAVLDGNADYCIGLKGNQKTSEESIRMLFNSERWSQYAVAEEQLDHGHGRYETRSIRVLPGELVDVDILEKWPGLKDGCIAEVTSHRLDSAKDTKSTEVRYFISSLCFNKKYIGKQMLHVIRSHWGIENKLHWSLDVSYDQDRTHCKNSDFLKGRTLMNKIVYNITTHAQRILEKETGKKISRKNMRVWFTNVAKTSLLLSMVCGNKDVNLLK